MAEKQASTPEALRNAAALIAATKAGGLAEVELLKADLAYQHAYVQLLSLIGKQ